MKRPLESEEQINPQKIPKIQQQAEEGETLPPDLITEILMLAEAKTVARAACASSTWRKMAADERVWEAICSRDFNSEIGGGIDKMRSVVTALGGFRKLHSIYMVPLMKKKIYYGGPALISNHTKLGKDEIQLSMALLSIGFFERMNRFDGPIISKSYFS